MRRLPSWFFVGHGIVVGLFILDRIAKWFAMHLLPDAGVFLFPGVGFVLERNLGIAYSLPLQGTLLIVVSFCLFIILGFLFRRAFARGAIAETVGYSLIIVGAFSNLLDRLHFGFVTDYMTLTGWPVFNLADVMILSGTVLVLTKVIFMRDTYPM